MPGIFGILQFNPSPSTVDPARQLERMHTRMAHLQIYSYSSKAYPRAAFGALSVNGSATLIETRHQGKPYLVLIDGHVYSIGGNRNLSRDSESLAARILALVSRGDDDALWQIEGNYTIAVYNPTEYSLLLFNDIFGARRTYYAADGDRILFAPEMKGICATEGFQKTLDWEGVADFLSFGYVLGERTLLNDIRSLPSATVLDASPITKPRTRKYWSPVYTESQTDLDAATSQCFNFLQASIAEKLPSSGSVISPISGGLDSRIILGILNRNHSDTDILPVTYGQTFSHEYTNARKVCGALEIGNHSLVAITPEALIDKYRSAAWLSEGMIPITNAHLLLLPESLGTHHSRVLNGIYGGPTNYDALYYAKRHFERDFNFDEQVLDIYTIIAIGAGNYEQILTDKNLPPIKEHAFGSIARELKNTAGVSERFCNQRDAFFIENRMRRCINQSALYRYFWDEHLPLANYELYGNYLDIAAELKVERKLLKSILKTYFPDLARIPDANTGLDLFTNPSSWQHRKSDALKRLQYYLSRISGGRVTFYDKTTYAHYGNWLQKHPPTYELWRQYLFSEDFLDAGLVNPESLGNLVAHVRKTGLGFHHVCRIATFSMWFNLFMLENSTLPAAANGIKNIISENR